MKKTLPLLALLGVLAGCATPVPDTVSYYDEFSSERTDLIGENELEAAQPAPDVLYLNAAHIVKGKAHEYYLEVRYAAREDSGGLDIYPGRSLAVTVDGREMRFQSASGSVNNRQKKKGVMMETAIYPTDLESIRAIAGAASVKVRVTGHRASVERAFTSVNSERFKKFVKQAVR